MTLRVGASLGGGGGGGPPSGGPFVPLDGSVPMTGRLTTGGYGITYSNVGPAFSGHDISFGWSGSAIAYFVDNIFLDTILGQSGASQTYVQLSGGIPMTGPLTLGANATTAMQAVTLQQLEAATAPLLARIAELEATR